MNKILFTGSMLILGITLFSCRNTNKNISQPKSPYKPNVLLIMTDDQGWGDLSSHGNDTLSTPNLDKLASASYQFDRFYVSPVCAPTRASLLTGRYHLRTGVNGVTGRKEVMRNTELTLAELFRTENYHTSLFGKWHNGAQFPHNPAGQGFDHFLGFCAGHWNNYFDTELELNGKNVQTEGYITDVLTDSAMAEIHKLQRTPFFMYIAYNTPHTPYQVPDRYFDKYKEMGLQDDLACIYGMVENIDDNVGRLLQTLEETGLSEKTIVIFLCDNGPNGWRYNGNLKGKKGWVDEGGVRVPFFMKVPWLTDTETYISSMAAHIDILPTLAVLCKLDIPEGLQIDGIDLSGYLTGDKQSLPDRFIYTARGVDSKTHYALRSQEYLLTVKPDTSLYNLIEDPYQEHDISAYHQDIVRDYTQKYDRWHRDVTSYGLNPPPIEIGHRVAPSVELPAHEATLGGKLQFREGHGWANDWIVNMQHPEDEIIWQIKVITEGYYNAYLELDSPSANVGKEIRMNRELLYTRYKLDRAYVSKNIISPDRVKRKEVYQKEWPKMELGNVFLEKGTYTIGISPGEEGFPEKIEIKSLKFQKTPE